MLLSDATLELICLNAATACSCQVKFCMFDSSHWVLERVTYWALYSSYDFTLLTAALSLNMLLAGIPVYFQHYAPERITACRQPSRRFAQATCICEHRSNLDLAKTQNSDSKSLCCVSGPSLTCSPIPLCFPMLSTGVWTQLCMA